jgi:hypothetical protein
MHNSKHILASMIYFDSDMSKSTNTVVYFDWKTVIYIYGIFKLFLLRKVHCRQRLFPLHCDEWDRVVALPRHKFVTGATLLQLDSVWLIEKSNFTLEKYTVVKDLRTKMFGQHPGYFKAVFLKQIRVIIVSIYKYTVYIMFWIMMLYCLILDGQF